MDKTKITMLGASGYGKTCYMLGMYADMQFGRNGFTFSAEDMDDDLELSEGWEHLIDTEGESRWPKATSEGQEKVYSFSLNYAMKPIIGFDWLDYRGGAIKDQSSKEDTQTLMGYIRESSCLLICVSGEYLRDGIDRKKASLKIKANRINYILQEVSKQVNPTQEKPFPVAIVITKFDLCASRKNEVIDDIKNNLFPSLFTDGSGWLTLICPVSLGKDLAENQNTGEIDPINVHLPVIFGIYSKLLESSVYAQNKLNVYKINMEKLSGNWLKRWINKDKIQEQSGNQKQLESQLLEMASNLNILSQQLGNANIYLGGKEVGI